MDNDETKKEIINHLVNHTSMKRSTLEKMTDEDLYYTLLTIAEATLKEAPDIHQEYVRRFFPNAVCVQDSSAQGYLLYTSPLRDTQIGSGSTQAQTWKFTARGLKKQNI